MLQLFFFLPIGKVLSWSRAKIEVFPDHYVFSVVVSFRLPARVSHAAGDKVNSTRVILWKKLTIITALLFKHRVCLSFSLGLCPLNKHHFKQERKIFGDKADTLKVQVRVNIIFFLFH